MLTCGPQGGERLAEGETYRMRLLFFGLLFVVAGAGKFGPLARAFAGAEPAAIEKAKQAIAEVLTPHEGSEGVRLPGACWLVQASAN